MSVREEDVKRALEIVQRAMEEGVTNSTIELEERCRQAEHGKQAVLEQLKLKEHHIDVLLRELTECRDWINKASIYLYTLPTVTINDMGSKSDPVIELLKTVPKK